MAPKSETDFSQTQLNSGVLTGAGVARLYDGRPSAVAGRPMATCGALASCLRREINEL